jgi:hypothetical protein
MMKKNKNQITGIKGRLLHISFVICYLLIVLLYACDDGYQPSVKEQDVIFYYKDIQEEIPIEVKINADNPFIVNDTAKELFIIYEIPSSIKEITLKVTYNMEELSIEQDYFPVTDVDHYTYDSDSFTLKGMDPSTLIGMDPSTLKEKKLSTSKLIELKVSLNSSLSTDFTNGTSPIKVSVEPGDVTATCKDVEKIN